MTRSGPKRYDHVYTDSGFTPRECRYVTSWLESRLSDHAAVEVDVDLPACITKSG